MACEICVARGEPDCVGPCYDFCHCAHCAGHWAPCREGTCETCNTLTFHQLTVQNVARARRWHPGFPGDDSWNLADWSNAMVGEAGEAANIVKKLRRIETGLGAVSHHGEKHNRDALQRELGKELADVIIYANLLAEKAGISLPAAIIDKFNTVSMLRGYPELLSWDS